VVLVDFHERRQIPSEHDKPGDTEARFMWPLVDVYAACKSGRGRPLSKGERATWWLRCLAELGLIDPPAMAAPRLPEEAPEEAQAVYEGFQLLLSLRAHYDAHQISAPFSYRFADRWCGVSWRQVEAGMTWLRKEGYLQVVDSITVGARQCNLYAIGQVRRAKNDDDTKGIDDLHLSQVQASGDRLRGQERTCLHQVQEAHGGAQGQNGLGGAEHGSTGGGGRSECKPGRTVAAAVAAFIRTTHARGDRETIP